MVIAATTVERSGKPGWWVFWLASGCVAAVCTLIALSTPEPVEAVRHVIRFTAQSSLLLFCTAFVASSLARLWPSAATRFLRRHRRQFGLAFAVSHGLHAVALVTLARTAPAVFAGLTDLPMYVFGGLAYSFIIAMAATSFDRSAAWLGPRRWRVLHLIGGWDLWLTFLVSEGKRAVHDVSYLPYLAVLFAVLALRLMARRRAG
jgi:methionine sulfoxide reductase heme-binding subunit